VDASRDRRGRAGLPPPQQPRPRLPAAQTPQNPDTTQTPTYEYEPHRVDVEIIVDKTSPKV
jgi:hypothetical protein